MPAPDQLLLRRAQIFRRRLAAEINPFPQPLPSGGQWHMQLPISYAWVDAPDSAPALRQRCAQLLIDCAPDLIRRAPSSGPQTRVLAAINLPQLFASQLIVFFGPDYWSTFFNRDSDAQRWTRLPPARSLVREWGCACPPGLASMVTARR